MTGSGRHSTGVVLLSGNPSLVKSPLPVDIDKYSDPVSQLDPDNLAYNGGFRQVHQTKIFRNVYK